MFVKIKICRMEPINQSINQSIKQSINQSINQSVVSGIEKSCSAELDPWKMAVPNAQKGWVAKIIILTDECCRPNAVISGNLCIAASGFTVSHSTYTPITHKH